MDGLSMLGRQFTNKYVNHEFTEEEKVILRPIAETLAMIDGNAFFTMELLDGKEWYEQYLPEAKELFEGNGGLEGWAGEVSWLKDKKNETGDCK